MKDPRRPEMPEIPYAQEEAGEKIAKVICSFCGHEMDCPESMLHAEKHICSFCGDVMEEGMSEEDIKDASEKEGSFPSITRTWMR